MEHGAQIAVVAARANRTANVSSSQKENRVGKKMRTILLYSDN